MSFNTGREAKDLHASGVDTELVKEIDTEDSGARLFGKPVPLILPIIRFLVREGGDGPVILTNSDIYPAIRSSSILRYWESCANALAMTREECLALDSHSFSVQNPYRGGVDTFYFSRQALETISEVLQSIPAAGRMAFGIPGWDYLVAASALRPEVSGKIMDGRVLLHVSHEQTYTTISEFSHYVEYLYLKGFVSEKSFEKAAEEFANRISSECAGNRGRSRMAGLLYYDRPVTDNLRERIPSEVSRYVSRLTGIAPQIEDSYSAREIVSMVDKLITEEETLQSILQSSLNSRSILFQFTETLFVTALALGCRCRGEGFSPRENYPSGNRHSEAIDHILDRYSSSPEYLRVGLAKLFGTELLDYQIVNRRIFNYLAFSCENDVERQLLTEIRMYILEKLNVSSAA
ncbi:MAG: hypothetical protein ACNS61_00190 [Candidatus Wenzhouxiangella sp. M2_3B_020]